MRKERGFTLIELLVVLTVSAILLSLAAPSFSRLIQSTKISGAVNTFLADLRFARSEAIRLGGTVTMCRSANPETTSASGPLADQDPQWVGKVDGSFFAIRIMMQRATTTRMQLWMTGCSEYRAH